jgi:hypothetical protein
MSLLASPKRRKRVAWLGGAVAAAALVVVVVMLFPNTNGNLPQHFSNTPVQRVQAGKQVPVTPARRRALDALFDRFVPEAIERKDPAAAYHLVTFAGRAGLTHEEWLKGQLPVAAFDAAGTTFHGYHVEASYADEMDLELDLQPAKAGQGPVAYAITVKRVAGRWLIDSIYARTSYAPTQQAKARQQTTTEQPAAADDPKPKTGVFLVLAGVLVALILGAPAVFFFGQWWSGRRHRSRFVD